MTSSSPKNYNKSGGMFTDMEYCEALGLDTALAGTPAINKAIEKAVYNQTKQQYMLDGIDEKTADKLAMKAVKQK